MSSLPVHIMSHCKHLYIQDPMEGVSYQVNHLGGLSDSTLQMLKNNFHVHTEEKIDGNPLQ